MSSSSTESHQKGDTSSRSSSAELDVVPSGAESSTASAANTYTTRTPGDPKIIQKGEFLHDFYNTDKTLVDFTCDVRNRNVFDVFLDYRDIITSDLKQAANEFGRHENLNRYHDIRCIDKTRVKVPSSDGTHDYIHANYVDGFREHKKFILTQAPLPKTVNQFWSMIWQENSVMIVSMTALDPALIGPYIPFNGGSEATYGNFTVVNDGIQHIRSCYDVVQLTVTKSGDSVPRSMLHMIFYGWPDKGTPIRPTEVASFTKDMNANRERLMHTAQAAGWLPMTGATSPIVVHCVAGVGRSGVIAALDICQQKLDYSFEKERASVDVTDTVLRIRTQREMAVQKPEQYLFLVLAVIEYALRQRYYDAIDIVDVSNFIVNLVK